ncbi:hypothetical protein BD408DRAFT_426581 [Parasitella parasitica]|nr:hypothetical protein BD408DRAFT_426581 [Parasitella parasitica]
MDLGLHLITRHIEASHTLLQGNSIILLNFINRHFIIGLFFLSVSLKNTALQILVNLLSQQFVPKKKFIFRPKSYTFA